MERPQAHTARYRMEHSGDGYVFAFFCALSGAVVCETQPVQADSREEALGRAWSQWGRSRFNRCHQCGEWVSDAMYNADTLKCVYCSPWEEKPAFCSQCGQRADEKEVFCGKCGARLKYGGDT